MRSKGILLLLAAATAVTLVPNAAFATATSGRIYEGAGSFNDGTVSNMCTEAVIADVADNKAFTYTVDPSQPNCFTTGDVKPSGYLGAQLNAYRDGAYCGQTGVYYSGSATWSFGVGALTCSNPAGSQAFYTNGYSYFYRGPSYPYNNGYVIQSTTSPQQNY